MTDSTDSNEANTKRLALPGPAPTFNTGGGGIVEEKEAGARALLSLLSGRPVPGIDLAPLREVRFQARGDGLSGDGWLLDDLIIQAPSGNGPRRCAVSVKSGDQFGETSAPSEFVRLAWAQLLGVSPTLAEFNEQQDLLCLACPAPAVDLKRQLTELLAKAKERDPVQFDRHMQGETVAKLGKQLYKGFRCPDDLERGRSPNELLPGRLLKVVRYWEIDFRNIGSSSKAESFALCADVLRDPAGSVEGFWNALCGIVDEVRPRGGLLTLEQLLDRLRSKFTLQAHPYYRDDLDRVRVAATERIARVRDTIAGTVHLDTAGLVAPLDSVLNEKKTFVLHGPSGAIKTSITKDLAVQTLDQKGLVVWLDCSSLNDRGLTQIESGWRIESPLDNLLDIAPHTDLLLILDGAEKLVSKSAFNEAAKLINAALRRWRVIITVISTEAERIVSSLENVGVPRMHMNLTTVPEFDVQQLKPVLDRYPDLKRLTGFSQIRSLLRRLKILDVFASHIEQLRHMDDEFIVGESSLIEWFWLRIVEGEPNRTKRSSFLKQFAARLADEMRSSIAEDELSPDEAEIVDELQQTGLLDRRSGRVSFDHDLYADWSRQQVLRGKADELSVYLKARRGNVAWHSAIRLLALHTIEHGSADLHDWHELLRLIEQDGSRTVQGNSVLDALAMNGRGLDALVAIRELLFANDAELFRRLINHLLIGHSFEFMPGAKTGRVPVFLSWIQPILFMERELDECIELAPIETVRFFATWVRWAQAEWPPTKPAARTLVKLALQFRAERQTFRYAERLLPHDAGRALYEGVLAAFPVLGVEAGEALLTLAERKDDVSPAVNADDTPLACLFRYGNTELPTCDLGPRRDVDDAFASVCANLWCLIPVIHSNAMLAQELIIATIIKAHTLDRGWDLNRLESAASTHGPDWYPPMWFRGCFLRLLNESPDAGANVIGHLAAHIAKCWMVLESSEGRTPEEVEIEIDGVMQHWPGDKRLFLAYRDLGRIPNSIVSALMALEKYLYDAIDRGENVAHFVQKLLKQGSVPIAGVLTAVGHYHKQLFDAPLKPLLGVAEFLVWDWEYTYLREDKTVAGISWSIRHSADTVELVHNWVNMPHRSLNLLDEARERFVTTGDAFYSSAVDRRQEQYKDASCWPSRFEFKRLLSFFDRKNYNEKEYDSVKVWAYTPPKALEEHDALMIAESNEQLFRLTGATRFVRLLEENAAADKKQCLEALHAMRRAIADREDTDNPEHDEQYCHIIAGAAATLIMRSGDCLNERPEVSAECKAALLSVCLSPPEPPEFDREESIFSMGWDRFAARALPYVWAENPLDPNVRSAIVSVIATNHHDALVLLCRGVAEREGVLRCNVVQLWRLILEFAVLRHRGRRLAVLRTETQCGHTALSRRCDAVAESFITNQLSSSIPNYRALVGTQFFKRFPSSIDMGLVRVLSEAAPPPGVRTPDSDSDWSDWWLLAVELVTERIQRQRPQTSTDRSAYDHDDVELYEDEQKLIDAIARAAYNVEDDGFARRLWHPFVALDPQWHRWIEAFFEGWLSLPVDETDPIRYTRRWREMIQNLSSTVSLESRAVRAQALGIEAIGPQFWGMSGVVIINGMTDLLNEWIDSIKQDWDLRNVAAFLRHDTCALARVITIESLLRATERVAVCRELDADAGRDVAKVAMMIWSSNRPDIEGQASLKANFRRLVDLLAGHHIADAVDLQRAMLHVADGRNRSNE